MDIQNFIDEFKQTFVYDMLSQTLTDDQIFDHFVGKNGEIIWSREQMRQIWKFAKSQAVPDRRVITLTCAELLEAFQFGAPDGGRDEDQMATEMTIEWFEDGHSGKGYYCYYSELPEEGAIKLGAESQEPAHE